MHPSVVLLIPMLFCFEDYCYCCQVLSVQYRLPVIDVLISVIYRQCQKCYILLISFHVFSLINEAQTEQKLKIHRLLFRKSVFALRFQMESSEKYIIQAPRYLNFFHAQLS